MLHTGVLYVGIGVLPCQVVVHINIMVATGTLFNTSSLVQNKHLPGSWY